MIDLQGHLEQLERMRRQSRQRSGSLRMAAARGEWDEFDGIAEGRVEDGVDGTGDRASGPRESTDSEDG
jgi:hypothetical protein